MNHARQTARPIKSKRDFNFSHNTSRKAANKKGGGNKIIKSHPFLLKKDLWKVRVTILFLVGSVFWPKTADCIGDTIGRHPRSTFTIEYRFLFSVFWHIFKNSVLNKYVRDSGLQVGRLLLIRHANQNGHFPVSRTHLCMKPTANPKIGYPFSSFSKRSIVIAVPNRIWYIQYPEIHRWCCPQSKRWTIIVNRRPSSYTNRST